MKVNIDNKIVVIIDCSFLSSDDVESIWELCLEENGQFKFLVLIGSPKKTSEFFRCIPSENAICVMFFDNIISEAAANEITNFYLLKCIVDDAPLRFFNANREFGLNSQFLINEGVSGFERSDSLLHAGKAIFFEFFERRIANDKILRYSRSSRDLSNFSYVIDNERSFFGYREDVFFSVSALSYEKLEYLSSTKASYKKLTDRHWSKAFRSAVRDRFDALDLLEVRCDSYRRNPDFINLQHLLIWHSAYLYSAGSFWLTQGFPVLANIFFIRSLEEYCKSILVSQRSPSVSTRGVFVIDGKKLFGLGPIVSDLVNNLSFFSSIGKSRLDQIFKIIESRNSSVLGHGIGMLGYHNVKECSDSVLEFIKLCESNYSFGFESVRKRLSPFQSEVVESEINNLLFCNLFSAIEQ